MDACTLVVNHLEIRLTALYHQCKCICASGGNAIVNPIHVWAEPLIIAVNIYIYLPPGIARKETFNTCSICLRVMDNARELIVI